MKLLSVSLTVMQFVFSTARIGRTTSNISSGRILTDDECCMLLFKESELESGGHVIEWDCEFENGEDVVINNIPATWASQHSYEMISGRTMFCAPGAWHHDGQLDLPDGGYIKLKPLSSDTNVQKSEEDFSRNRELANVGAKKVLVVRYDGNDIKSTADASTLQDRIFGTFGDSITPASQYYDCSHGKLSLVPYNSGKEDSGTNGVITLKLSTNLNGISQSDAKKFLLEKLNEVYGISNGKPNGVDHVIYILPPSAMTNTVAFAYANWHTSYYSDGSVTGLSIVMHELGHNMGLGHSGVGSTEYADTSGYMGYGSGDHDGPLKCFNGPKSWKLGWYEDKHLEVDPLQSDWVGNLVGFADYGAGGLPSYKVIVKIFGQYGSDRYIWFNRKSGMNSGTSYGDVVHITQRRQGLDYATSYTAARLDEVNYNTYKLTNWGGSGRTVYIRLNWIDKSSSAWYANVGIYSDSLPPVPPGPSPTPPPPTPQPQASPTPAPVPNQPPTSPSPPTSGPSDIYINCGSDLAYVDTNGVTWEKDNFYGSGGGTYSTGHGISGTNDPKLYQSERWAGDLKYNVPCSNGEYSVKLHLADIYFGTHVAGKRVFDIYVQGKKVVDNVDIYSSVGGYAAMTLNFPMMVEDGECRIEFVGEADNPKLNALEIHKDGNNGPGPTTAPPNPTPQPTRNPTPQPTRNPTPQPQASPTPYPTPQPQASPVNQPVSPEGYIISRNADFSSDDREFYESSDTLHLMIWSDEININNMRKTEYEIKVGKDRFRKETNTFVKEGRFFKEYVDLAGCPKGEVEVKIKLEDEDRNKFEVKGIMVNVL